jgi:hypothetical protein
MPKDSPPNGSALDQVPVGLWSRVSGMLAKLHWWAVAEVCTAGDELDGPALDRQARYRPAVRHPAAARPDRVPAPPIS